MAKLISSRCSIQSVVPESYILPPEQRPGNSVAPPSKTIPIIDLDDDRIEVIQEIIEASQEYGFFQVKISVFNVIWSYFFLLINSQFISIIQRQRFHRNKQEWTKTIKILRHELLQKHYRLIGSTTRIAKADKHYVSA